VGHDLKHFNMICDLFRKDAAHRKGSGRLLGSAPRNAICLNSDIQGIAPQAHLAGR
jgi:hypothetical protein